MKRSDFVGRAFAIEIFAEYLEGPADEGENPERWDVGRFLSEAKELYQTYNGAEWACNPHKDNTWMEPEERAYYKSQLSKLKRYIDYFGNSIDATKAGD